LLDCNKAFFEKIISRKVLYKGFLLKIIKTKIEGLLVIEPLVHKDERGYFFESYREDMIKEKVGEIKFLQDNESYSSFGVLRGLHYQLPPFAQNKLVRVVSGRVLDVAVDIRKNSLTFGEYVSIELSGENKKQFFISKGFAHGYIVLSETAIFQYKVDNYYSKEYERGIIYNDPEIKINWTLNENNIQVSPKDRLNKSLSQAEYFK